MTLWNKKFIHLLPLLEDPAEPDLEPEVPDELLICGAEDDLCEKDCCCLDDEATGERDCDGLLCRTIGFLFIELLLKAVLWLPKAE